MWCSTTLEENAESAILISHHSGTGPLHIFLNNFSPDLVAETSRFYLRNGGPSGVPITPRKSLSCPFSTSLSPVTLLALPSFHSFCKFPSSEQIIRLLLSFESLSFPFTLGVQPI